LPDDRDTDDDAMLRFSLKADAARDRVAPEALNVAPSLVGQPLARPLRRAAAMLVDLAIIGVVSAVANVWLLLSLVTVGVGWARRGQQAVSTAPRLGVWWLLAVAFAAAGVWELAQREAPQGLRAVEPAASAPSQAGAASAVAELARVAATAAGAASAPIDMQDVETRLRIAALEAALAAAQEQQHQAGRPRDWHDVTRAVADEIGLGYGWSLVYFTLLPAWWRGQTVGKRCFGIAVVELTGKPITLLLSLKRFGGYAAGLAIGGLGLAQVWWDRNRQGIHDKAAHTVVIDLRRPSVAAPARDS
jgi:uncharacterized RDD family membrane protein YckC